MSDQPSMTPCPAGDGTHVDLGQAAVDVAAALEAARAEGRQQAADAILAHADRWAPADRNLLQRRMRRHLHIAARVAVGPPTMAQVAEALKAGRYSACYLDEAGQAIGEGER